MYRSNAGTGEHRNGEFRDHRQIENNAIPFSDAQAQKNLGKTVDLAKKGGIAQHAGLAVLALPIDGHLAASPGVNVPVHTLIAGVQPATDKPSRVRFLPFQNAVPRLHPVELSGLLIPKDLRVLKGIPMHLRVSLRGPNANPRFNGTRPIRSLNVSHLKPPWCLSGYGCFL